MKVIFKSALGNAVKFYNIKEVTNNSVLRRLSSKVNYLVRNEFNALSKDLNENGVDYKNLSVSCSARYNIQAKISNLQYIKVTRDLYQKHYNYDGYEFDFFLLIRYSKNRVVVELCKPDIVTITLAESFYDAVFEEYFKYNNI